MTTIRKIFKADLYGLFHKVFALVIAVGLCILPALYAWFNIYANWDPYANTGNIRIAVANLDEGCTDLDGEDANMGQEIVEQLKQKDNIGWVFVDSKKDAVDRVKSGDCYAAVVIDPEFSYGLYNALMDNISQPKITYYENEKKNAVATKITDTAVSTLQSTINQSFVKVVTQKIFTQTNDLQASLKDENAVDAFIEKLETVQGYLKDYDKMITSFLAGNELVTKSADDTNENLAAGQEMIQSGIDSMEDGKQNLKTSKTSFAAFSKEVTQALNKIQQTIDTIDTHISAANLDKQINTLAKDVTIIQEDAKDLSVQLQSLSDYLKTVQGDSKSLENTIDTVNKLQTMADNIADIPGVDENASDAKKTISAMQRTLKNYSDTIENINWDNVGSIDTAGGHIRVFGNRDSIAVFIRRCDHMKRFRHIDTAFYLSIKYFKNDCASKWLIDEPLSCSRIVTSAFPLNCATPLEFLPAQCCCRFVAPINLSSNAETRRATIFLFSSIPSKYIM